jgi:hypothetical protein
MRSISEVVTSGKWLVAREGFAIMGLFAHVFSTQSSQRKSTEAAENRGKSIDTRDRKPKTHLHKPKVGHPQKAQTGVSVPRLSTDN